MEVWTFAPEVMNGLMALSVIFFGASVALYFKDGQEFTRPVMVMLILAASMFAILIFVYIVVIIQLMWAGAALVDAITSL